MIEVYEWDDDQPLTEERWLQLRDSATSFAARLRADHPNPSETLSEAAQRWKEAIMLAASSVLFDGES